MGARACHWGATAIITPSPFLSSLLSPWFPLRMTNKYAFISIAQTNPCFDKESLH